VEQTFPLTPFRHDGKLRQLKTPNKSLQPPPRSGAAELYR